MNVEKRITLPSKFTEFRNRYESVWATEGHPMASVCKATEDWIVNGENQTDAARKSTVSQLHV